MSDLDDLAKAVRDRAQGRANQPPPMPAQHVPYARPMPPPPPASKAPQGPFMIAFKVMLGIFAANALLLVVLFVTVILVGAGCLVLASMSAKNAQQQQRIQPAPRVVPAPS